MTAIIPELLTTDELIGLHRDGLARPYEKNNGGLLDVYFVGNRWYQWSSTHRRWAIIATHGPLVELTR